MLSTIPDIQLESTSEQTVKVVKPDLLAGGVIVHTISEASRPSVSSYRFALSVPHT